MSLWQASSGENIQALYKSITQVVRKICSHAIWIGCALERETAGSALGDFSIKEVMLLVSRNLNRKQMFYLVYLSVVYLPLALSLYLSCFLPISPHPSLIPLVPFSVFLTSGVIWNDDKLMLTKPSFISLRRRGMKASYCHSSHTNKVTLLKLILNNLQYPDNPIIILLEGLCI